MVNSNHGGLIIPKIVFHIENWVELITPSSVVINVNKDLKMDYDGFNANRIKFLEIYFDMDELEARKNEFYLAHKETIDLESRKDT